MWVWTPELFKVFFFFIIRIWYFHKFWLLEGKLCVENNISYLLIKSVFVVWRWKAKRQKEGRKKEKKMEDGCGK